MVLLFKTESGEPVSPDTNSEDSELNETLVTFLSDAGVNHYLLPASAAQPYEAANGCIMGVTDPEADDDPEAEVLVQHFALMTGEEPCFCKVIPDLAEYIEIQKDGPGVDDGGTTQAPTPWRRYQIPPTDGVFNKGIFKNVQRIIVIGWLL